MNAPRLIGLAVALIAGGIAFFVAMNQSEDAPVEVIQRIEEKTVRVLVADAELHRGDRLNPDNLKWVEWPEKTLSPLYLKEGSVSMEELTEAVARTLIVEGEPIIDGKIVRPGAGGMMSALLAPGMRAITTRVTAETASGGFILPGDRVDVYYTAPNEITNDTEFDLLLEDVKILAIDAYYSEDAETPHIAGATATLELSPDAAAYFITARNSRGQISLALRSAFEPKEPITERKNTNVDVIRYGRS
ncbi:MAG: Flp pilus assembly protein CpaB [Alphaproteobacteria bacterium]|nr:Flp pilus assembly protein CpaB [Alphaproteobacteria bacterium]